MNQDLHGYQGCAVNHFQKNTKKLKNGHWIIFSECSWPHQKLVLEFIKESLVNDKIITVDSKISRK